MPVRRDELRFLGDELRSTPLGWQRGLIRPVVPRAPPFVAPAALPAHLDIALRLWQPVSGRVRVMSEMIDPSQDVPATDSTALPQDPGSHREAAQPTAGALFGAGLGDFSWSRDWLQQIYAHCASRSTCCNEFGTAWRYLVPELRRGDKRLGVCLCSRYDDSCGS